MVLFLKRLSKTIQKGKIRHGRVDERMGAGGSRLCQGSQEGVTSAAVGVGRETLRVVVRL
jgi:hypothetical protein